MINEIVKFSGILRENGIPASVRSTKIACKAVPLIENNDGNLQEALACIYLKDQRQRKKFNEIYTSFFEEKGKDLTEENGNLLPLETKCHDTALKGKWSINVYVLKSFGITYAYYRGSDKKFTCGGGMFDTYVEDSKLIIEKYINKEQLKKLEKLVSNLQLH